MTNTLKITDRVRFVVANHFLLGEKGTVEHVFDISARVKMDNGVTIITTYTNLKKFRKSK